MSRAVVGDLNGTDFQRAGIDTQMHLAPLAPVLCTVLLAFPLAFTQELDAGAVDEQVQCRRAGLLG